MERRLLDLVGEVHGLLELDAFRTGLLEALRAAVPSDWASLNDIGPEPGNVVSLVEPPLPVGFHAVFAQYAHENPLVQHFQETRDARVRRISDVATPEQLHATNLYREFYAKVGVEYQLAFVLPARAEHVVGV